MSDGMIGHLRRREHRFAVMLGGCRDPHAWISDELLGEPAVAASLDGLGYSVASTIEGSALSFAATYRSLSERCFVFLVRNDAELACAVSLALRKHLTLTKIVIDNRSTGIDPLDVTDRVLALTKTVGEDLEVGQTVGCSVRSSHMCLGNVITCTLEMSYLETPSTLNALTCVISEHARAARERVGNDPRALVAELLRWFRENVRYLDTNANADHTAAGLLLNGTAVCQGIAVYAHQFLWSCGIRSRYVSGISKGEPHAWNVVEINGVWRHIDYTFALTGGGDVFGGSEGRFRSCHEWDEDAYSSALNDSITEMKHAISCATISMLPDRECYSVNGCVVDTSNAETMCISRNGALYVSAANLFQDLGGGCMESGGLLTVAYGTVFCRLPIACALRMSGGTYLRADTLPNLGLQLTVRGDVVSIVPRGGAGGL